MAVALSTLAWSDAASAVRAAGVTIDIATPQVSRRTFDLNHPVAEMPKLTPPEVGTCVFKFDCAMETQAAGNHATAAHVNGVVLHAKLTVTIWTPFNGPARVVRHEEAHRKICEAYYRKAVRVGQHIADELLGTTLIGDTKAQMERELDGLQRCAIREFLDETATRCEEAQRRFDAITAHSLNPIPEGIAMAQAMAEEAASYQSKHPTWVSLARVRPQSLATTDERR